MPRVLNRLRIIELRQEPLILVKIRIAIIATVSFKRDGCAPSTRSTKCVLSSSRRTGELLIGRRDRENSGQSSTSVPPILHAAPNDPEAKTPNDLCRSLPAIYRRRTLRRGPEKRNCRPHLWIWATDCQRLKIETQIGAGSTRKNNGVRAILTQKLFPTAQRFEKVADDGITPANHAIPAQKRLALRICTALVERLFFANLGSKHYLLNAFFRAI